MHFNLLSFTQFGRFESLAIFKFRSLNPDNFCVGIIFIQNPDGDVLDIQADIIGPGKPIFEYSLDLGINITTCFIVGTAYEGGVFKCKIVIDSEFPSKPPKGNHS